MITAMISGHLDLTPEEFHRHYEQKIHAAIMWNNPIVVGDAPGADTMAQELLHILDYKNVTVYYNAQWNGPRNNVGKWPTVAIGEKPWEKDEAMTKASLPDGWDIAWVRPGKEKSGTAANIKRRAKLMREVGG